LDLASHKALRIKNASSRWDQYPLGDHEEEDWSKEFMIPGTDTGSFSKKLSEINSAKQGHSIMSLVSCDYHNDDFDDQKATALIIPYKVSRCHFLEVEGERHSLKPMHIYAFNQLREHRLAYVTRDDYGETMQSMVASLLNVCFFKKGVS
jgi:hypothetical protein